MNFCNNDDKIDQLTLLYWPGKYGRWISCL